MINLNRAESAVSRVEQAKRLIQQARLARISADARVPLLQDQIDTTQRASEASVGLTRMFDAMNDPEDTAPRA